MNIEKIKSIFNEKSVVIFKLYSLNYTIQKVENGVVIFSDMYNSKKEFYSNIDILLKNYIIFGENIEDNEEKIINIH